MAFFASLVAEFGWKEVQHRIVDFSCSSAERQKIA